jgi:hypothetical protein
VCSTPRRPRRRPPVREQRRHRHSPCPSCRPGGPRRQNLGEGKVGQAGMTCQCSKGVVRKKNQ